MCNGENAKKTQCVQGQTRGREPGNKENLFFTSLLFVLYSSGLSRAYASPDLLSGMNWYAIYTKPKCEDSTALHLKNAGIEVLTPKIRIKKYLRGKYVHAIEPLFKNYIFASFDHERHTQVIRFTRGVKYIVGKENPVVVPVEIIRAISEHMGEDSIITPVPDPLSKGDRVLVKEGPFANFYGIFEREIPGRDRIVILLEALGSRLEIEDVSVRKA